MMRKCKKCGHETPNYVESYMLTDLYKWDSKSNSFRVYKVKRKGVVGYFKCPICQNEWGHSANREVFSIK